MVTWENFICTSMNACLTDSSEIYVGFVGNMGFIIACKIGTEKLQTDLHSNDNYPKKAGSHK